MAPETCDCQPTFTEITCETSKNMREKYEVGEGEMLVKV